MVIRKRLAGICTLFMIFMGAFSINVQVSALAANNIITDNATDKALNTDKKSSVNLSAKDYIADLQVYDELTSKKWTLEQNLQIGDIQYNDKTYMFASIPDEFIGGYWIKTAADTKNCVSEVVSTFKVVSDTEVYILHDDRIKIKPLWLSDWTDIGEDVFNNEATPVTFSIYKRTYDAGSLVNIGNNGQVKDCANYTILFKPLENNDSSKTIKRINLNIDDPMMYIDGMQHEIDEGRGTAPLVIEGRTMLPIRAVIEAMGGSIHWDEATKKVSVDVADTSIELWIDKKDIMVNGERKENDVAPKIINQRTFLPLRFIAENAGCVVGWDGDTKSVIISTGEITDNIDDITWETSLKQKNIWYGSDAAIKIANNILLYQREDGGWFDSQDTDMTIEKSQEDKDMLIKQKENHDSTIGNGSTTNQLIYLAKAYHGTGLKKYKEAFIKGLSLLLDSQYENGGWPQYLMDEDEENSSDYDVYKRFVTYTDTAMVSVLKLMNDIVTKTDDYSLIDDTLRTRCKAAYNRGIDCILNTQVVVNGNKTAWSDQYNNKTLEPAMASDLGGKSISSHESADIVEFLMTIKNPKQQIIDAVKSAVQWIESVKIVGIKEYVRKGENVENGSDKVIINDSSAPNIWARFYEIGTDKPIFFDSDETVKYSLAELNYESRNTYSWYTYSPAGLIAKSYPQWAANIK